MKNSKMITSIVLIVTLLIQTVPVYAQENNFSNNNGRISPVSYGEQLITEGFDVEKVARAADVIEYKYQMPNGVEATILESEDENGNYVMTFIEGEKEDSLQITPEGEIWLNGKKIEYSVVRVPNEAVSGVVSAENQEDIIPYGRRYNITDYVNECPYGTEADYSTYVELFEVDVEFNEFAKNLTINAISGLIFTVMTMAGAPLGGLISGTVFEFVANGFIAVAQLVQDKHPLSIGSRIYVYRYEHKTYGRQIPHSDIGEARFVYKDEMLYYVRNSDGKLTYSFPDTKYLYTRILTG